MQLVKLEPIVLLGSYRRAYFLVFVAQDPRASWRCPIWFSTMGGSKAKPGLGHCQVAKGTAGGYYQVGRVIPWDTDKYCGEAVRATWFSRVCVFVA